MAKNNRQNLKTDLFYLASGETDGKVSQPRYPYLKWCSDTWRRKYFYKDFLFYHEKGDKQNADKVLKQVWCEHNTVCRKDRKMLTPEILVEKCYDMCPTGCGNELWYGRCNNALDGKKNRDNKPSIDKLDPNGKYTDDNTWVICTTCNTMKQNAKTPDRLRLIADAWEKQIKK